MKSRFLLAAVATLVALALFAGVASAQTFPSTVLPSADPQVATVQRALDRVSARYENEQAFERELAQARNQGRLEAAIDRYIAQQSRPRHHKKAQHPGQRPHHGSSGHNSGHHHSGGYNCGQYGCGG